MSLDRPIRGNFKRGRTFGPGLVMANDGTIQVVSPDGGRLDLVEHPKSGPITLSAPAQSDTGDTSFMPFVAPYDGFVAGAGYLLAGDIAFTGGESRTWTLETVEGTVYFSLTLDADTGGASAGTILVLELVDYATGADVVNKQPLVWRSNGDVDDPGGMVIVEFVDPDPVALATVSEADFGERRPGDVPAPIITGFNPSRGAPGSSVTINGKNFTGTQAVHFGAFSANAIVQSDGTIVATVPDEGVGPGAELSVSIEVVGADGQVGVSPSQFVVLASGGGGGGGGDIFGWAVSGLGLALAPETDGGSIVIANALKFTVLTAVTAITVKTTISHRGIVYDSRLSDTAAGPTKTFASSSWNGSRPVPVAGGVKVGGWGWTHDLRWTYKGKKYSQLFKGSVALSAAMVAIEDVPDYAKRSQKCFDFYVTPPRLVAGGKVRCQAVWRAKNGCTIVSGAVRLQLRYGDGSEGGSTLIGAAECSFGAGTEKVAEVTVDAKSFYGPTFLGQWIARGVGNGPCYMRDSKGVVFRMENELFTPARFISGDIALFKKGLYEPDGAGVDHCFQ